MSGYNNTIRADACNERADNEFNDAQYNYMMNPLAVTRAGVRPTDNFSIAQGRDFYGAFTPSIAKKEAFLQGRGQTVNGCAECEVISLPESIFNTPFETARPSGFCASSALDRMNTRAKRSQGSLSEAEISQYSMFPGGFEEGYSGYNSVVDTFTQTRMASLAPVKSSCGKQSSYATYGIGDASGRYGLGARQMKYE